MSRPVRISASFNQRINTATSDSFTSLFDVIETITDSVYNYNFYDKYPSSSVSDFGTIFQENRNLISITIYNGFDSIADNAFMRCTSLITVTAPYVKTTGYASFLDCHALISIDFPELTEIDASFTGCSVLATINAPKITIIGTTAFSYCHALISIDFPLLDEFGYGAFQYCEGLTSVTALNVQAILSFAFGSCPMLKNITINFNTTFYDDDNAFQYCTGLETVYIRVPYANRTTSTNNMIAYNYSYSGYSVTKVLQLQDIPIIIQTHNVTQDATYIYVDVYIDHIEIPSGYENIFVKYTIDAGESWNDCTYENSGNADSSDKITFKIRISRSQSQYRELFAQSQYREVLLQSQYNVQLQTYTNNGYPSSIISRPVIITPTITSDICFLEGSLVKTNKGYIDISKLDTRIHKINNNKNVFSR